MVESKHNDCSMVEGQQYDAALERQHDDSTTKVNWNHVVDNNNISISNRHQTITFHSQT